MTLFASILSWFAKFGSRRSSPGSSAPSSVPLIECLTPQARPEPKAPPLSETPPPVPPPQTPTTTSLWSPYDCRELQLKLWKLAKDQSLTPEYRKECLRHANNLRFVARVRAKENRHPQHPTLQ